MMLQEEDFGYHAAKRGFHASKRGFLIHAQTAKRGYLQKEDIIKKRRHT